MAETKEISENTRLESDRISSLSYIQISNKLLDAQVVDNIVYNFNKKGLLNLGIKDLNKWNLESIIENIFEENNIDKKEIEAFGFINGYINLHLKSGDIKVFNLKEELNKVLLKNILKNTSKEEIEKRVANINGAIEEIFKKNNFLINGEINDKDKLNKGEFKDKTLKELKELLDKENKKLFAVYDITGETHKKQKLLKQEIKIYTGIGDDYEGGAGYFKLSLSEIYSKVEELCSTMSIEEVFEYTRKINSNIDGNFRRSDLVEQVNLKLINSLYKYSFDRLKEENGTNKQFVELIKVMTGRGKLDIDKSQKYEDMTEFDYENKILSFEMSQDFANTVLANNVLIHLVYKPGGLLEEIKDKNKDLEIKVFDEELEGKTPGDIYSEAEILFDNSVHNKIPEHGKKSLDKLGYSKFSGNTDYSILSFTEKIEIGALYRIIKEVKKSGTTSRLNDQLYIDELSKKFTDDTFIALNESFSDNFDESLFDWDGTSAEDLGLKGAQAEIFELYQDINGNEGILDWKDSNVPGLKTIAIGVGLVASMLILGPAILAATSAETMKATILIAARASLKLGTVGTIIEEGFSHQGYESYEEGFYDVGSNLAINIMLTSIFTVSGLSFLKYKGFKLDPDLLDFFTKEGLIDKSFMLGEAGATMWVSSIISDDIKRKFIENHTDTDNK